METWFFTMLMAKNAAEEKGLPKREPLKLDYGFHFFEDIAGYVREIWGKLSSIRPIRPIHTNECVLNPVVC